MLAWQGAVCLAASSVKQAEPADELVAVLQKTRKANASVGIRPQSERPGGRRRRAQRAQAGCKNIVSEEPLSA
jgi:hypothetical protein